MEKQVVYVYHEYDDEEAYGTQEIVVFAKESDGLRYLRERVKQYTHKSWEQVVQEAEEDDTVTEDYVSLYDGNKSVFFSLDEKIVN